MRQKKHNNPTESHKVEDFHTSLVVSRLNGGWSIGKCKMYSSNTAFNNMKPSTKVGFSALLISLPIEIIKTLFSTKGIRRVIHNVITLWFDTAVLEKHQIFSYDKFKLLGGIEKDYTSLRFC